MVVAFASCSMKMDHNKYINIEKVLEYLAKDLAWKVPQSAGKVKILKKCMKQAQKVSLLNEFGETSTVDFKVTQNTSKFLQTIYYAGREIEHLMESRVRLYRIMKTLKIKDTASIAI